VRRSGPAALALLLAAGVVLIAVELGLGALNYGRVHLADPCVERSDFPGSGLDGAVQQLALDGLDGAACKLHATREELVLSFSPDVRTKEIRWDRATIDAALSAGFSRAVDDAKDRGGPIGLAARFLSSLSPSRLADWLLDR
jgi:hypothetical protein